LLLFSQGHSANDNWLFSPWVFPQLTSLDTFFLPALPCFCFDLPPHLFSFELNAGFAPFFFSIVTSPPNLSPSPEGLLRIGPLHEIIYSEAVFSIPLLAFFLSGSSPIRCQLPDRGPRGAICFCGMV